MEQLNQMLELLMTAVRSAGEQIPLGISNRHIHLSQPDLDALFGSGYQLSKIKALSQPGQYAAKECITICGPKGAIEQVRILGPVRKETQVEVLRGDCFKLGIAAPVRMSADLDGSPGITLVGPAGSVFINKGVIVAQRHIHMTPEDARRFDVADGDVVAVRFDGIRGGSYENVVIRANGQSALECHLDTEEANALDLNPKSTLHIMK